MSKSKPVYQKKTQKEHILLRPDTYIGSVEETTENCYVMIESVTESSTEPATAVATATATAIAVQECTHVPGLYKIFDEIIVNSADNTSRGTKNIKIVIKDDSVSVWNDGHGIPIETHSETGFWTPELVFGHLLTSSNYDDSQKRLTGGRNGFGAKLCNVFSKKFIVETSDGQQRYVQEWTRNMDKVKPPSVTNAPSGPGGPGGSKSFTKITFWPDFEKFGMTSFTSNDTVKLMIRRAYDIAGITKAKVTLNGTKIPVKTFVDYCKLYNDTSFIFHSGPATFQVVISVSTNGEFKHNSFVNSICTNKGGPHVRYVTDKLLAALMPVLEKKLGKRGIKKILVKSQLCVMINAQVHNPTFSSQTKEELTTPVSKFGTDLWELEDNEVKKILKCQVFMDQITSLVSSSEEQSLKKTDGKKKKTLLGIPKLDDANFAGTKRSKDCTLILTEGDSAKSLAVCGIAIVGRDKYGCFPLKGKLLNVREASAKQVVANQEIQNIKTILGLKQGVVYTTDTLSQLRYGSIMIMADQDQDGSHIKGLVINFLAYYWPSLLEIPGFLKEFITPIIKVTGASVSGSGSTKCFFTLPEFETWQKKQRGKFTVKYYKGLGTSTSKDAKTYFSDLDTHEKSFAKATQQDLDLVTMAFAKDKVQERKNWLEAFTQGTFLDHTTETIKIEDFVNRELVLFSLSDNVRSIPNLVDGLKPGQRKVMFACFKRKLKLELKVAQLSGYVAENSAYHHGEASLNSTIVNLAQDFVGSNNINLLEPVGQFGTRLAGGKDSASPRYIFTHYTSLTEAIFDPRDFNVLDYLEDDGQSIEPQWYVPVIPMVLVNGSAGIGTGYSTKIPNYNPQDVINYLRHKLGAVTKPVDPMIPWYRGFTGTITSDPEDVMRYKCTARYTYNTDSRVLDIYDLPIGTWTNDYKQFLEKLVTESVVDSFSEYHTDNLVHFKVVVGPSGPDGVKITSIFKLSTTLSGTNMVLFGPDLKLRRYTSPEAIIDAYLPVRLDYYSRRKKYLLKVLEERITLDSEKIRFIQLVLDNKLVIRNRKLADIHKDLVSHDFKKISNSYDYLLGMSLMSLTFEKITILKNEINTSTATFNELESKSSQVLWLDDLEMVQSCLDAKASTTHVPRKKVKHGK